MSNFVEELGITTLLMPFPGELAAGADPRQDFSPQAAYRVLRTARTAAREAERAADADADTNGAAQMAWRTVRRTALTILSDIGKDMEAAAWLTEALVRDEGLRGLAAGAQIITGLAQRFWSDGLLPLPENDSFADRVAPVEGLSGATGDGTIVQPLRKLSMFMRPDGTLVPLYKFNESAKLQNESDKARIAQRVASGAIPFADLERDAKAAGSGHFAELRRQVSDTLRSWDAMAAVLDSLAGAEGPSTGRVRTVLEDILGIAQRYAPLECTDILPTRGGQGASASETGPRSVASARTGEADMAPNIVRPGRETAARMDREAMLKDLARIAEYFRRTEPNSPLAATLDEAIRRARLTFPEMMEELLPDASARGQVLAQLGIRMPRP